MEVLWAVLYLKDGDNEDEPFKMLNGRTYDTEDEADHALATHKLPGTYSTIKVRIIPAVEGDEF